MLIPLIIIFCAAGAIFLLALTAYNEAQDRKVYPDHRVVRVGSRRGKDRPK